MNPLAALTAAAALRASKPALHVRWALRRDLAEIVAIEADSYDRAWTEEDFLDVMRSRDTIVYVAVRADAVVGYVAMRMHAASLEIVNLAVAPGCRHQAVGSKLVDKVVSRIYSGRRTRVDVAVREGNLPAQLFFKNVGFRATSVSRDHFDNGESAYLMAYSL